MLVKINNCSQYHVIVILAFALSLGSCSKRVETPYIVIEDFPVDSTLSPLPLPQLDELPGIYDISSAGDYYLCTEKKTDYFFTLYDSDFVRICSFARKGKASGEYIAPVYTGQYFKTADGTRLHIYDRALQKFDIWQIPSDGSDVELISSFRISNDSTIEIRVLYESLDRTFFGVSIHHDKKTAHKTMRRLFVCQCFLLPMEIPFRKACFPTPASARGGGMPVRWLRGLAGFVSGNPP